METCKCGLCRFGKWIGDYEDMIPYDPEEDDDGIGPTWTCWAFSAAAIDLICAVTAGRDVGCTDPLWCPGCGEELRADGTHANAPHRIAVLEWALDTIFDNAVPEEVKEHVKRSLLANSRDDVALKERGEQE